MGTRSKRKVSIELEMNESWSSVPISSIANSAIGGTPSRGEPQYWGGTTPWATAKDVASVSGRYLHQVEEFITDKGLKSSTAKLMPEGTVVITARGTVGALAQLGQEMAFNQTCYAIVPSDELDNNFLFYALKGTLAEMRTLTYGSVFETITKRSFDNWRIPCPQLPVQRSIAHILGTLDDKIELNRQINQTLEEMAHAIYKDWFVDFGPTRAKMGGQEPYLPPELWDLFPDELVDSELGEIPEKWSLRNFGDLLDDVIGGDWGKEFPDPTNTEPVAIIRGTDIPSLRTGSRGSVPTRFTSEKKAERRKLQDGDIVIEVSGGSPTTPTGRSMIVTTDILERFNGTVVCASFCRRLRPSTWTEGMIASQHLDYLNSIGKMWEYQLQSTGISNFQTKRFLEEEQVIWPDHELATAFANTISPIIRTTNGNGSKTLAETRDALLPMLLSGEVNVTGS